MSSPHVLALAGLVLTLSTAASNAGTVTAHPTVPAGFPATDAIHFNGGSDITTGFNFVTGHTVTGTTYLIDFTSNEPMEVNNAGSGGAATVKAVDGQFQTFIVSHDNPAFGIKALEINIDGGGDDGTIEFFKGSSYVAGVFVPGTAITSLTLDENGQNKFYILADVNEIFSNLGFRVTAPTYFVDLKQIAINTARIPVVPLPSTALSGLALLTGLATLQSARRRVVS